MNKFFSGVLCVSQGGFHWHQTGRGTLGNSRSSPQKVEVLAVSSPRRFAPFVRARVDLHLDSMGAVPLPAVALWESFTGES